jgi:hypothetical protein
MQKDTNGAIGSEQLIIKHEGGPRPTSWSRDGQVMFEVAGGDIHVRAQDGKVTPFRQTEFFESQGTVFA